MHVATLPQKTNHTVVLVDDDTELREALTRLLTNIGFHVMMFEDGASALRSLAVEDKSIYAIVTDFEIPLLDGISLIRELCKKQIEIPIMVLISGNFNASLVVESLSNATSVKFLEKPFAPEDLLSILQREELNKEWK